MKASILEIRNFGYIAFLAANHLLGFGLLQTSAQPSLLANGSFEIGDPTQGWYGISNWTSGEQWGGMLVTTNNAYDGTNVMRMLAFGSSSHVLEQRIPVAAGKLYEVDGQLRTLSGAQQFSPTNGYCTIFVAFYNSAGIKIGDSIEAARMTFGGPLSWTRYTTGPALAPAGAVTGSVSCFYFSGGDQTANGWVEYDDVRAYTTTPTQAGALLNPDFEVQTVSAAMPSVAYWTAFGNAGAVVTNYRRNGRFAFQLWWTENLLGQSWAARPGKKYATSAYMFSPSSGKFTSSANARGVVLLQFLDAGSNVLQTFESAFFTTSSPADTWVFAKAEGVAPAGTVYGRSMAAILGPDAGFGGSIYFDDFDQYEIPPTTTVAGLLYNPGFDDGFTGNAYYLSNHLPYWIWLGGTNAGFVVDTVSHSNEQSLAIVWPNNLAAQSFRAETGLTYIVEGYVMTPSGNKMTSETAYATVILEFYNSVGGTDAVSAVSAVPLTKETAADTWVKVSVTNRAPWVGTWVTGRVYCALLDPANGAGYAGTVYFDTLRVDVVTQAIENSRSGALWNPGFEYSADGTKLPYIDSWTNLGLAGNVDSAYKRSGEKAVKIYWPETLLAQSWPATPGWRYSSSAYMATPSTERLQGAASLHGVVLLQFFDETNGLLVTYVSGSFTTNEPANVWTHLTAVGAAPARAVSGRTVVGLLGTSTDFAGSLYVDDVSQSIVSTSASTAGLLFNPGFEDGPPGNCYYLSNNLPYWSWRGGTNAGYVVRDYKLEGEQALVITYPHNGVSQDWAAEAEQMYKAEGWLFTPSAAKFQASGDQSYGCIEISFYANGHFVTNYQSAKFGTDRPADTWIYFAVTGQAPAGLSVSGRVSATIASVLQNPGDDPQLTGVICFDLVSLVKVGTYTSAWEQWQMQHFGSTSGPGTGLNDDYDGDGYSNWSEFVAGTQPTNAASVLALNSFLVQGTNIVIQWPSVTGRAYRIDTSTNLASGAFLPLQDNILAAPPMNTYTDRTVAVGTRYYRIAVTNRP